MCVRAATVVVGIKTPQISVPASAGQDKVGRSDSPTFAHLSKKN